MARQLWSGIEVALTFGACPKGGLQFGSEVRAGVWVRVRVRVTVGVRVGVSVRREVRISVRVNIVD